eukprot:CAMPEP_0172660388 /NCGR_PEP_ID=MMETSP1074-20121228/4032_1 /TAXON_ID=2916 /ORGANISM="Ceratium fusus, Strain PA161109" /LENGTH=108 /DNA_ID=CAMNT_0013476005 /DNA_START=142 /DNA_END=469 /DNA_ORIENTATION=-
MATRGLEAECTCAGRWGRRVSLGAVWAGLAERRMAVKCDVLVDAQQISQHWPSLRRSLNGALHVISAHCTSKHIGARGVASRAVTTAANATPSAATIEQRAMAECSNG